MLYRWNNRFCPWNSSPFTLNHSLFQTPTVKQATGPNSAMGDPEVFPPRCGCPRTKLRWSCNPWSSQSADGCPQRGYPWRVACQHRMNERVGQWNSLSCLGSLELSTKPVVSSHLFQFGHCRCRVTYLQVAIPGQTGQTILDSRVPLLQLDPTEVDFRVCELARGDTQ